MDDLIVGYVGISIGVSVLLLMVVGGWFQFRYEHRIWNGGFHSCGEPWKLFDMDSQGGRGYICRSPQHEQAPHIWINYPKVDAAIRKEAADG